MSRRVVKHRASKRPNQLVFLSATELYFPLSLFHCYRPFALARILQELSLDKLRAMEGRTHEDPLREVAALQYLSSEGHPNVLTCTEVMWKTNHKFCGGGGIFGVWFDWRAASTLHTHRTDGKKNP